MKKLIMATCLVAALSSCSDKSKLTSGIHPENFDTSVKPTDDFFEYACGGWMKNHPLKPEYSRFGTFDQLRENNVEQVKTLIEEISKSKLQEGSDDYKIGTLYNLGMDSVKLNADGFKPVLPEFEAIAKLAQPQDVQAYVAAQHLAGSNIFFALFAEADLANSTTDIAWIYQSGLGLGERDYYLEVDPRTTEIRAKYRELMATLMAKSEAAKAIGVNMTPEQMADAVLKLETAMAKVSMDRLTQRDPYQTYHKMTVEELQKITPDFDFAAYFTAVGLKDMKSLNVAQPEYMKNVTKLIKTTKTDDLKAYFAWHIINDAAAYLDDATQQIAFDFYGKVMSGKEEMSPRWKRVVNVVNFSLGEVVGEKYVGKYFPPAAKQRMLDLVKNLQIALGQRIDSLTWMNDSTKMQAHKKLDAFLVKIGYPDTWRDYSGLTIKNDNYYANIKRSKRFEMAYILGKVDKPKNVNEWQMTPQTVNAYYNPTTNEICFPAGILQPPFFDMNADDAANYGAIGVVIGHEMTHGFDDKGCLYDDKGNLANWWAPADAENFKQRANVLVERFNAIEVAPGVFANGAYTLGENIADNGGLQIAWLGMQQAMAEKKIKPEMDGFSAGQRFFIAYATLWANNIREQELLRLTKEDSHSLGRWRVNETLKHIGQFAETFGVKEGDGMYLAPDKRASIW